MAVRPFVEDIFRSEGKWIKVFTGKETVDDPYEKNVTVVYTNPLPVLAIIVDFTSTQSQWKMPGIKVQKAKELFIHKKYRPLMELSQKIEIDGEAYEGWRESGKMQIRDMGGNTIRLYVYTKAV